MLIASGVLGFRVGYVGFPTWHVAVQTAQVLAGLVTYPPDNPFYIYHARLWTLLHQLGAVALRAGVSEMQLSLWLSGAIGMIAFQAIALVVFAMSHRVWLSLGAAFLLVYSRAADHGGVVYPILLMGTEHTYGAIALSGFVLVVGLLGAGAFRIGGVLLGMAPGVHPSFGAWLWLVVALAGFSEGRLFWERARVGRSYLAAGVAVTVISLVVQLLSTYEAPPADPEVTRSFLSAFTTFWDGHRRPVDIARPGVMLNALALVLSLTWLLTRRRDAARAASFVPRVAVVSAGIGAVAILISWMPAERVPQWLLTLMPSRLLNVNALMLPPLLIGIVGGQRGMAAALLNLGLTFGVLTAAASRFWDRPGVFGWLGRLGGHDPMVVFVAGVLLAVGLLVGTREPAQERNSPNDRERLAWILHVAAAGLFAIAAVGIWRIGDRPRMFDHTNDPLFMLASQEREGVLAASGAFHLPQLVTRRPVLLNAGALDTLPYAPESAPAMDRILKDLYAIDLRDPPDEIQPGLGSVPDGYNRKVWEQFSVAKWQDIRRRYDVRQVMTPAYYDLTLPIAAQSHDVRLYVIPE